MLKSTESKNVTENERDPVEVGCFGVLNFLEKGITGHFPENILYEYDCENPARSFVSQSVQRVLGYRPDEFDLMCGSWWRIYIHSDDHAKIEAQADPAVWAEGEIKRTFRLRHKHGHWVEMFDQAIVRERAGGGKIVSGCLRDISSRQSMQSALLTSSHRYQRLLGSLAEGVVVHNVNGEIVDFNNASLRILGLNRDELSGVTPIDPRWSCVRENGEPFPGDEHPAAIVLKTTKRQYGVVMGVRRPQAGFAWIRINAEPLFKEETGDFDGVIVSFADITQIKEVEIALNEREQRYRQMFQNTTAVNLLVDPSNGQIEDANLAALTFYGFEREGLIGRTMDDINLEKVETVRRCMATVTETGVGTFSFRHQLASGDVRDVIEHAGLVLLHDQKYIHSTIFDVTERKLYERQLEAVNQELDSERQRLNEIIWGTNVGTWEWHVQTGDVRFNERWAEIIGYRLEELGDEGIQTWMKYCHPDDLEHSNRLLQRVFDRKDGYYECECRMRHRNGEWVWVLDRGKVVEWDANGKPLRMSGTHTDITLSKKTEEKIRHLAQTDHLTGLANRHQFNGMLSQLVHLNRRLGKHVVLMLLDLDYFKSVNDTYGHPVGDKLLMQVAKIIKAHSRDADVVARLGGDEFAVILPLIDDVRDAATPAKRIIEEVSQLHNIDGHEIRIGISVGISTCRSRESDAEVIYRDADKALYQAKKCGRNRFCYYDSEVGGDCSAVDPKLCGRCVLGGDVAK